MGSTPSAADLREMFAAGRLRQFVRKEPELFSPALP